MSEEIKQMQDDEREALASIYEGDDAFKQANPTTFQYKVSCNITELLNIAYFHFIIFVLFDFSMEPKMMSTHFWLNWFGVSSIQMNHRRSIWMFSIINICKWALYIHLHLSSLYIQFLSLCFVQISLRCNSFPSSFNYRVDAVKEKIVKTLNEEAEQWIGCGMTYTLFECLKDRLAEMMEDQPQAASDEESGSESDDSDESDSSDADIGGLSLSGAKGPKKERLTKAQKRRQWDQAMVGGERARGWDWVDIVKHLSQVGNKDESGSVPQNYDGWEVNSSTNDFVNLPVCNKS